MPLVTNKAAVNNLVHIGSLVLLVPLRWCLGVISQKWGSGTVPLYVFHCHKQFVSMSLPSRPCTHTLWRKSSSCKQILPWLHLHFFEYCQVLAFSQVFGFLNCFVWKTHVLCRYRRDILFDYEQYEYHGTSVSMTRWNSPQSSDSGISVLNHQEERV